MLLSDDQVRRRRAMPAAICQRSAPTVQPELLLGRTPYQTAEQQSLAPLSFPSPTFGPCRRITEPIAQGQSSRRTGYTLVSGQTGRAWLVIDSIRDCQFGEVVRGVELVRTSSGRWTMPTGPPNYVAIKEVSVARMRNMQGRSHEDPHQEVSALQYLSQEAHPNVLQCIEAMRDERRIYIVTAFCNGGELFDVIAERGRLEEDEARPLFRQALKGLLFLKRRGVCHRDVSLENMLLGDGNVVKIIDLGLALRIPQGPDGRALPLPPQGVCGKQFYMAPEVLSNSGTFDGFAVDVWACGIMLFVMLTGIPPFEVPLPSRDQRCRVIAVEERLGELLEAWRMPVSPEAVDLMQSCLTLDPARRPTIEELLSHEWFTAAP